MTYGLLIKGGTLIDPAQNIHTKMDVAFAAPPSTGGTKDVSLGPPAGGGVASSPKLEPICLRQVPERCWTQADALSRRG